MAVGLSACPDLGRSRRLATAVAMPTSGDRCPRPDRRRQSVMCLWPSAPAWKAFVEGRRDGGGGEGEPEDRKKGGRDGLGQGQDERPPTFVSCLCRVPLVCSLPEVLPRLLRRLLRLMPRLVLACSSMDGDT